jgi:SAM-dependent methyltransferase
MTAEFDTRPSFRDPAGKLFRRGDRILRTVNLSGIADLEAFLGSPVAQQLTAEGKVVGTRRLQATNREALLEHDRIPFPSFPYEWPPEMLFQAARLTLELALRLQRHDIGLKDATPYNVLFRGPEPVFIDILSFEQRVPGDASWLPYAQFIRTFLLPLLANRHFGLALDQLLLTRRDGLEPEDVYKWTGSVQKWLPPFLSLVTIPTLLGRRHKQDDATIYRPRLDSNPEKAAFILRSLLQGLLAKLTKLEPRAGRHSGWSDYLTRNNNYSEAHFEAKKNFVNWVLQEFRPRRVLDVGCNTGLFSATAARAGAQVVAIDYDPVVVGETWRTAHEEHLDILPLVVNLSRPTPGAGWRNSECPSFIERARGSFDCVLMLAVTHHLLVTERVPLDEIASLAADLTSDVLVVEFIAPQDSMFVRLARGREALHKDLDAAAFEACFQRHFDIARVEHCDGTFRWLYALRKRR